MSQPPPGQYPPPRRPLWFAAVMALLAALFLATFVQEMTNGHTDSVGWKIAPAAGFLACVAFALFDLRAARAARRLRS